MLSSNICVLAASTTIGIILKFPFEDLEKKSWEMLVDLIFLDFFFFFTLFILYCRCTSFSYALYQCANLRAYSLLL